MKDPTYDIMATPWRMKAPACSLYPVFRKEGVVGVGSEAEVELSEEAARGLGK